jgi:ribosome-binding protein aMBF1 (putative translation factor)
MKAERCEECGKKIPSYTKAYIDTKIVCQKCYFKNRKSKYGKQRISEFWKKWREKGNALYAEK